MFNNEQILEWLGRLGAATADDVATRFDLAPASAARRLADAARQGLVARRRLLHDQPALFVCTALGLRSVGLDQLSPARVSSSSFEHWRACASVAVALERIGTHRVISDRELRALERVRGQPFASAELGMRRSGEPDSHHPDLVLIAGRGVLPVAVEVEIAVKAPRRLHRICRAWARSRTIAGVVYCASPRATRAVRRAVEALYAQEAIQVVALEKVLAGDTAAVGEALARLERAAQLRCAERAREPSQVRPSFV